MDDTASRNEESHYQDSQSSQLQPSRRSYPPNDNQIFQHRSSQPSIPGAYYQSADSHSRGIESALPRNCSSSYQYDSRDVRFHRGPYPDLRPDFDAHREPHLNFRPDFEATPRCSRHSARPSQLEMAKPTIRGISMLSNLIMANVSYFSSKLIHFGSKGGPR